MIKLKKFFDMQRVLKEHVELNHPTLPGENRFSKYILALLVEVGEIANEHRGFKFWSNNQQPRVKKSRVPYMDLEDAQFYNPMLEEFVDGFHFILDLGIVCGFDGLAIGEIEFEWPEGYDRATDSFLDIYDSINDFYFYKNDWAYNDLLTNYIQLGADLGFTWDEIEQAYLEKNKINHQRQENGY